MHSMAPLAICKFLAQAHEVLDRDGEKWINISRQAGKATQVPHVAGSDASSIMGAEICDPVGTEMKHRGDSGG